jgi:parvulin-like peptidyl-prolyl isomerase
LEHKLASQFLSSLNIDRTSIGFLSKNGLLENLVSTWILCNKLNSVQVDETLSSDLLTTYLKSNELNDEAKLASFSRFHCLDPSDLSFVATKQYRLKQILYREYFPRVNSRFLKIKESLTKLVYRLIRLNDAGFSRELYLQISEGDIDFGEASALHSKGPERLTYGIVGPVQVSQIHPLLASTLTKAQPNITLPPIQIDDNWVIVRLEQIIPSSLDDATSSKLATTLLQEDLESESRALISSLSSVFGL